MRKRPNSHKEEVGSGFELEVVTHLRSCAQVNEAISLVKLRRREDRWDWRRWLRVYDFVYVFGKDTRSRHFVAV